MAPRHTQETFDRVCELANEGFPPRAILVRMPHLNRRQLTRVLSVLRSQGRAPRYGDGSRGKSQIPRGNMEVLLASLNKDQRTWLFTECAKIGVADIAEYLAELVRDAYEEAPINRNIRQPLEDA